MIESITSRLFRREEPSRICCFHIGRCGSTLLGNMLNSHPEIDWLGEIFHPLHENLLPARPADPSSLLTDAIRKSKSKCFGFETKFQHLKPRGLNMELKAYLEWLQSIGFGKFILLKRNNMLRQAVSVARGQQTKTWHVKSTDQAREPEPPIRLDLDNISLGGGKRPIESAFQHVADIYQELLHWLDSGQTQYLDLNYETDLERNPKVGLKRVLEFAELRQFDCPVSLRKLEQRPLQEAIENFDELKSRLRGTEYQWMLEN